MSANTLAQSDIITDENFNNNAGIWFLEKDEKKEFSISGGHLRMNNFHGDGAYTSKEFQVDPRKDFFFESRIIKVSGPDLMYGIYFADTRLSKNNKWFYYLLSADNKLIFCENSNEKLEYTYYQTDSPVVTVNPAGNVFGIEKKGAVVNFYFNHEKIFTLSSTAFWGSFMGFAVYSKGIIDVDYVKIRQKFRINLSTSTLTHEKENLGTAINSAHEEVMPVISADGNTLYISVEGDPRNTQSAEKSDIWYSTRKADGSWNPRKNIGFPLSTVEHDFIINAPPDNNTLFINGEYKLEDGVWNKYEGMSVSNRTKHGWATPEKLEVQGYYNYAKEISFAFSPDRKVLVSSIERDISFGSNDLYVSFLQDDGSWSEPDNMGSVINSYGEEITPFIAADGKTMYFSTNGKPGYGGHDIFYSKRLDHSWKNWSEPVNLGHGVNTANWDAYYTVPAAGDFAYIVSNDKSHGKSDIYRIRLVDEVKPEPVVMVSGKVFNKATNAPLEATITYHDLSNGKEMGIARSNPADGSYTIVLPYSKVYGFLAEHEGFLSESNNLDLSTISTYQEVHQDLYLMPFEIGKTVAMNNIFFVRSKPDLLPESYPEIERLLKVLKDNPAIKIELAGHTDNVGNPELNRQLSEQRVITIKNYLVSKGVASSRIAGKGYGGTKPIADNNNEATRKLNRRVEFTIVK
ncbi:MAG TPA: OmpA family protein [Ohtaekwangia sp.]